MSRMGHFQVAKVGSIRRANRQVTVNLGLVLGTDRFKTEVEQLTG